MDPLASSAPRTRSSRSTRLWLPLRDRREEGLVVIGNKEPKSKNIVGVGTLLDGDPTNNFLERAATFNPEGILHGALRITIAGTYAYILPRSISSSSISRIRSIRRSTATLGEADGLADPRGVQVQFRYGSSWTRKG